MGLDAWKATLGRPYYEADGCLLFHADCVPALQAVAAAGTRPADLVVTSPPYNIGKSYERPLPLADYLGWCDDWLRPLPAVLAPAGAFWLNLGYRPVPGRGRAVPLPYLLWDRVPFHLLQEVVWNYGAGVAGKTMFSPRNEKFLWYVADPGAYTFDLDAVRDPDVKYPNQRKHGKLKCNPLGKNPSDVWQVPKVTSGAGRSSRERTAHPAQFPVRVIDRIVRACSRPREVVVDPFAGSGSTAAAALAAGRLTVGIEIDRDYCEMAARRLRQQAARPVQAGLF